VSKLARVIYAPKPRMIVGEGPVWDERTQTLYCVDIERMELHSCDADGSRDHVVGLGERLGSLALRERGPGFIAGLEHRIGLLTINPLSIETLATPEADQPANSSNDGKCDLEGRFWVGTLHKPEQAATGWLYRIDPDGSTTRTAGPFICVNGPEFSPDGKLLYCVDSYGKTIYSYEMDERGNLSRRRVFVTFEDPSWGFPDGLTCDVEACLWVAHWGGSRVSRFSPSGRLLESIELPASQVTSCTFGGPDLRTLFVTSASMGLDLSSTPRSLDGALFAVDLDVGGFATRRYAG
jgi:xylono-1,5-lactonase